MKIFVGSSTKKKPVAEKIASALEAADFQVFRWWNVFQGGDYTLDRLIQLSDACDGSVFIFGADDINIKINEQGEKKVVETQDNVLLEYGLFVGKTSTKKTLFVREKDVKIPSDLNGITYINQKNYIPKIVQALKDALGNAPPSQLASRVVIHASRNLLDKVRKETPVPLNWYSRSLYIGSRGANAWAAVEEDQNYSGRQDFDAVRALIEKLVKDAELKPTDCIVSFGPGLGLLDKEVLPILSGGGMVEYIAVDINDYLAVHAADFLDRASKQTQAPFCIVADFENDMSVITDIVHERTGPGRVFMMLGGTFGNLERGEDGFLNGLHACMHPDDVAILDVFTYVDNYTVQRDSYHNLNGIADSIKHFLAVGVERRFRTPIEEVMKSITSHVKFETKRTSQIENTREFSFRCMRGGLPLIYVRRYDFESFKKHLEDRRFDVIGSGTVGDSNRLVRRSVFFLKKRQSSKKKKP